MNDEAVSVGRGMAAMVRVEPNEEWHNVDDLKEKYMDQHEIAAEAYDREETIMNPWRNRKEKHKHKRKMKKCSQSFDGVPLMPCTKVGQIHREKLLKEDYKLPAMVARPVGRKEVEREPKAQEARGVEWSRLWARGVWATADTVEEWDNVIARAKRKGISIHIGHLFGICVEKGSELGTITDKDGRSVPDPRKKYKYRVVFQGNRVVDQDWQAAEFMNQGSAPASMEASRMADMISCFPGNSMQQADATQAYVQAL